jgi:hypothetical protein
VYGRACRNEQNGAKGPEAEDLQVVLSAQELEEIVGVAQLVALKHTPEFPVSFTTIKLRRCSAVGKCINFHTDFSKRTMQVALNAPDDYGGGELIFANVAGLHIPPRPVGSATIHGAGATPDCMPNSISKSRAFASLDPGASFSPSNRAAHTDILHGVAELTSGVRYGLFFLDESTC